MTDATIAIQKRPLRIDFAAVAVWAVPVLVTALFFWILGDILVRGLSQISWSFLIESPTQAGRGGGIGPILVSTAMILAVCLATAVPLATGTALLLAEFVPEDRSAGRVVRVCLDALAGIPSIVFGIFGNVFFSKFLGLGFSILSGGLTLACMVLPVLIRTTEQSLREVPDTYRFGISALGFSKRRGILKLILPLAGPGITVGILLGVGRALAETAALIFTSGYVDRMPASIMDSGRSLSIHIFDLSMNVSGGDTKACATAAVLIATILLINGAVLCITNLWQKRAGLARSSR